MTTSLAEFARELRAFDGRREVTRSLRARIRRPVPQIRRMIRARAVATLPDRHGLNDWVARTRVTVQVRFSGRSTGVRLVGARRSDRANSDVRAIDRGRVRAPSWGRRNAGAWHVQTVTPGFFTLPATDVQVWRTQILAAVDDALKTIRG